MLDTFQNYSRCVSIKWLCTRASRLCTLNMPVGRYSFKRLPFELKSAPIVFHRTVQFYKVPGTYLWHADMAQDSGWVQFEAKTGTKCCQRYWLQTKFREMCCFLSLPVQVYKQIKVVAMKNIQLTNTVYKVLRHGQQCWQVCAKPGFTYNFTEESAMQDNRMVLGCQSPERVWGA